MILSYKDCIKKYGNAYQISKQIAAKKLYKLENGYYSAEPYPSELEIITLKYPKAVLTSDYAFFIHGLTDVVPEKYFLATAAKAAKITDPRVKQIYERDNLLWVGVIDMKIDAVPVKIYDKERMLIELLRNKNTMPYDLYKEILNHYRQIIDSLEIWRIEEYADTFPKSKMINKALSEEVF